MYHSITITGDEGSMNTWTDWHLIPTSRPFVALPTVNKKTVEIPGRNGVIDLTTFLTGSPTFGNRKGSWEFYIVNKFYLYSDPAFIKNVSNWESWSKAVREISGYCHGKVMSVTLEDDPDYSYKGRLEVSYSPQSDYSTITINYDFDPEATLNEDKEDPKSGN